MRRQRGFTLVELLAVMAIIGILAGVVAGSVAGLGASGQNAQIQSDTNVLETAADRFFNDSFPQTYPVADPDTNNDGDLDAEDSPPSPAGDVNVRLIDFDARLPQDPTKTFTPDFIKDIPNSAALVSYRVVTTTGTVFAAADGAALIPPANSRLDVTVATKSTGIPSAVTFDLTMSKNRAAVELLKIKIPAGYIIGGQSSSAGLELGTLDIFFDVDNPWKPGHVLKVTAPVLATGRANKWEVSPNYATARSEANGDIVGTVRGALQADGITRDPGPTLTHKLEISQATTETPGTLTLEMDREGPEAGPAPADVPHNESRETWTLTIYDYPKNGPQPDALITNPTQAAVYRWTSQEHSTIQVEDVFESVAGKQAVLIKDGPDGDILRPVVSVISPSNHATNVPVSTDIIVTFSEAINVDTVFDSVTNLSSTFTVSGGSGTVAGSFVISADLKIVTFDPTSVLEEGTFYAVTLTSGITDDDGNTLVPVTSTFTTVDTTAPTVSVVPIDGANGVPVDTQVVLTFSELVTNVNGSTFTVQNRDTSTGVTGNVTQDGLLAIFVPAENLEINTTYDVTVTTGVTDLSGNNLDDDSGTAGDQEFTSTFTTFAFASCADILANNPGAVDGNYTIDPAGAGPIAFLQVYCDMTFGGGGWTLIESTNSISPNFLPAGVVTPFSGTYMPTAAMQALATISTQVHIRSTGNTSEYVTSSPGTSPIVNLRAGLNTNNSRNTTVGDVSAWSGPFKGRLTFRCRSDSSYPNIYQACGNNFGLHIWVVSKWNWCSGVCQSPAFNIPLDTFVR